MEDTNLQKIGRRISERRKQLGYTQEQLAEEMDVSIQMISNLERGIKAIRIENLTRISQILGISTDYILTGKRTVQDTNTLADQISHLKDDQQKMIEMLVAYCLRDE